MTEKKNSFRDGSSVIRVYGIALAVASVCALALGIGTESFLEWVGLLAEVKEGAEETVPTLSKLGVKMVLPVRLAFIAMSLYWAMEIFHVRISMATRTTLADAEERPELVKPETFQKYNFFLTFYQLFLVICVLGGFIGMMVVPSILKSGGVKAPEMAALTMLTWIAYVGPLVFCALRFQHAGITRDTRLKLAALAAAAAENREESVSPLT